jgi:hypothetical protein
VHVGSCTTCESTHAKTALCLWHITLLTAHLVAEDASLLHNPQTFASAVAEAGNRPVWGVGRNLVLQRGEATVARISVARAGPKKKGKRELFG